MLAQAPPVVADGGVLNAANLSRGQPVTLGSFVAIFGSGFGNGGVASTVPWPTSLGGTTVLMNGIPAPLYAVTDGQINAQLPFEVFPSGQTSGSVIIIVQRGGQSSAVKSFQVVSLSPGIFSIAGTGLGLANAINPDGALAAPSGAVPPYASHPAAPGGTIIVLATGLGATDNPIQTGQASSDALRRTTTIPTVLVGGIPAQVVFSGLSPQFPAVNQLNIVLPVGVSAGAAVPLQVSVGGFTTTGQLNIAITGSTATSALSLVATVPTPLAQPKSLAFYGSFAYLCASQYIAVLDISSPANPRLLSTVGSNAFSNVTNMFCYVDSGNLVAFTDTGSTLVAGTPSVTVFSLANPAQPRLLNQTALNKQFVSGLAHRGNTAFAVFNSINFSGSTFLNQGGDFISVDVSNPASPRILSTLSGSNSAGGGPNVFFDIFAVNDTTAFAASSTSTGNQTASGTGVLVVVDTSDPNNLRAVKQVPVPGTRQVASISVQGTLAVTVGNVEGWRNPIDFSQGALVGRTVITTFDISDPRNPVLLATSSTSVQPAFNGGGGVPIGSSQFAFASTRAGNQNVVLVVDARSPQNARSMTLNAPDILHRVEVAAPNFLYALVDNTGVMVYQIN